MCTGDRTQETPIGIVTRLFREIRAGNEDARERLLPLVYHQLRSIAQQRMAMERRDHTLQATALVHEAYLRLVGRERVAWNDRAHFYNAAAEAMRRLLVEHARARGRLKRGGGARRELLLSVVDLAEAEDPAEIMSFDAALRRLESRDSRAAEVVRLRFFAGLTVEETSAAMGLSAPTVKRSWEFARAFLYRALEAEGGG